MVSQTRMMNRISGTMKFVFPDCGSQLTGVKCQVTHERFPEQDDENVHDDDNLF